MYIRFNFVIISGRFISLASVIPAIMCIYSKRNQAIYTEQGWHKSKGLLCNMAHASTSLALPLHSSDTDKWLEASLLGESENERTRRASGFCSRQAA